MTSATPSPHPNPFAEPVFDTLGVRLTGWAPGFAEFTLPIEPRHLNYVGRLHGGLVAMLLDVACGYSALPSVADRERGLVATVSLAVNYLAGAPAGAIVRAQGRVTGGGRRIVFASAELTADSGAVIATAQGSFRLSAPEAGNPGGSSEERSPA